MLLLRLAIRNLWTHKWKTAIVGGLLTVGTLLVVVGQALLASLDLSMSQSIVHSISGHIQVSKAGAKDRLKLFGSPNDGTEIGHIEDFPRVRKALEALPGVEAVVPMGFNNAVVYGGNILDVKLAALRKAEREGDRTRTKALRNHVRRIVGLLRGELGNLEGFVDLSRQSTEDREGHAAVETAAHDAFWQGYDADPQQAMEFLENRIAPMAMGEEMMFLRYIGTDTARFTQSFHRFELVDGKPIPPGQRGFLFNKLNYEDTCKHKTARRLDKMQDRIAEGWTLKSDAELKQWMELNQRQYKEITYQLDDLGAADVRKALQAELGSQQADLQKLIQAFMAMDDKNFAKRYKLFYAAIAPYLQLYAVNIGDVLTINGLTDAGYPTSVNVPVYGTFRFRSLDKSALAGATSLTDMMTFRDLFGHMTADRREELQRLQQGSGIKAVAREDAEAALFGADSDADEAVELAAAPTGSGAAVAAVGRDASAPSTGLADAATDAAAADLARLDLKAGGRRYGRELFGRRYNQQEIDGGVVRHAAVVLKPGTDERAVLQAVRAASDRDKLGLTAIDWREASGLIGNFIGVIYAVLATALLVIFIVALVILNNTMVMATAERVREIGTLRAIGAQRTEILAMFLAEALVLGALFGTLGAGLGVGGVLWAQAVGIPAVNDVLVFLFAGPRLYPFVTPLHVGVGLLAAGFVTVLSTLYPAWLATRIEPVVAMQGAE
ncbi:MAG: FtsX-like permease family protein [Myxococcales bacterium]|nr:FtsX-like permease family protein [Myxococcales bacterium]